MPDYTLDIPDEAFWGALASGRKRLLLQTPADYAGELDMHLRTPASTRLYKPEGLDVYIVNELHDIREAMYDVGLRSSLELSHLKALYKRAGMRAAERAESYMVVKWSTLQPLAPPPAGILPTQKIFMPQQQFTRMFTTPSVTGGFCKGNFNFKATALRIVESAPNQKRTGWEINSRILDNGVWHGTLRKLPAAFALAAGFKDGAEAAAITHNKFVSRGENFDYDMPFTAVLFEPVNAKNITFRPSNDSIIDFIAARSKSGWLERKLQL